MMYPRRSPILASRVGKPIPTDLAAWYRYNTGITSASGTVSAWANQVSGGEALVQATAGNRPTLESDGTILFNGVDQFLKTAPFTLNQPTTVYFLGRQVTRTSDAVIFDGNTSDSLSLFQGTVDGRLNAFAGATITNNTSSLNAYQIYSVVFNGASGVIQVDNLTQVAGDIGSANAGGFTLGRRGATSTRFSNIQAKEILIYNVAHDANQRAAVIAYLNMVNQL
jgi:hypothetical protein